MRHGRRRFISLVIVVVVIVFQSDIRARLLTCHREDPRWLQNATVVSWMNESTVRCPASDLGFFTFLSKFPQRRIPAATTTHCYHQCFSRGYEYAGHVVDSCYCSRTMENVATSNEMNAANSADVAKIKDVFHKVHMFKRRQKCENEFTKESLEEAEMGCIPIPTELSGSMTAVTTTDNSAQQCILSCETSNFTLAIPIMKFNVCICSDMFSVFKTIDDMNAMARTCNKHANEKRGAGMVKVYQTFAGSPACGQKKFLKSREAPAILLTSLPGSGNTWLRYLIESLTGIYTGSVYSDKALFDGGFLGEYLPSHGGRIIAIKDHLFGYKIDRRYKSAISLVRNLYDTTLADFARITTLDHTGSVDVNVYKSQKFHELALRRSKTWLNTQRFVLGNISSVIVVYFEDLLDDPISQMRRIADFLPSHLMEDHETTLEKRLMCMFLDMKGNFRRPPKILGFDPFDEQIRKEYSRVIRDMDTLMRKYNQQPLPASYYLHK